VRGAHEEEQQPRPAEVLDRRDERNQHRQRADGHAYTVAAYARAGIEHAQRVETKRAALPQRVPVQQHERREQRREAAAVDDHQLPRVVRRQPTRDARPQPENRPRDQAREHELHRKGVEHDDEEQHAIDEHCQPVFEVVAAEKQVMLEPDPADHRERDGEGRESDQNLAQAGVVLGNFKRDDQEGEREAEDGVAEAFDAGDLSAAKHGAIVGG
jgi:hypothetical protein